MGTERVVLLSIDEWGTSMIWNNRAPELMAAADDGCYDVYDITDCDNVTLYYAGNWVPVASVEED